MKMQSLSRRTVLVAAAAALASRAAFAQAIESDKQAAGALAAQGWLVLLDRKDWGRAWETTGSVFRSKVPLGTWMDAIPKVRDPLGAMVERKQIETAFKTTLQGQPDGEYVTVVFQTKFTNREVAEVLTLVHEPDGKWRVTGYSAQ
jgi:hypothetical protein